MNDNRVVIQKSGLDRRNFMKWGSLGLFTGTLSQLGPMGSTALAAQTEVPVDHFNECVLNCRETTTRSLLNCFFRCLPELQIQPRPISTTSLTERLSLIHLLRTELEITPVAEIVDIVFPCTLRYPAWLVAGMSVELFELVLGYSTLPEFELNGWAFEHVLPHTASIDQALTPLGELLANPEMAFSSEIEAIVAEQVEALRGRLRLLGDKSLVAMAETIKRVLAQGDTPAMMRIFATINETERAPAFQATFQEHRPDSGDIVWTFNGTLAAWTKIVRKDIRAIDKVVTSILTGGLLF